MERSDTLLTQLLRIPSVNPMGQTELDAAIHHEHRLTAFLELWLGDLNVAVSRQHVLVQRENLQATWISDKPDAPHLLWEVHQDTVPVAGMKVDPFGATRVGRRMFGRGAVDNKGPMTAMLLAFRRLATEKPRGAAHVTLAFTVDEEHSFLGVQELVRHPLPYAGAIVAEPTDLNVVRAHKGVVRWAIETSGRACHSSAPQQGINAIYRMAHVLAVLEKLAADWAALPPDPLLGTPTLSVGRINGGTAVNIVPDRCRIEFDTRPLPGTPPTSMMEAVQQALQAAGIGPDVADFSEPWVAAPGLPADANQALAHYVSDTVATTLPGRNSELLAQPYGTNAAWIAEAGVPAVVFGPGSITEAHTVNESIDLDEIDAAAEVFYRLALDADALQQSTRT